MADMTVANFHSTEFNLDRQIEQLVGKQVRGGLTADEAILLSRLVSRRTQEMRPRRGRYVSYGVSAA